VTRYRAALLAASLLVALALRDVVPAMVGIAFGWPPPTYWLSRSLGRLSVSPVAPADAAGCADRRYTVACGFQLLLAVLIAWAWATGLALLHAVLPVSVPWMRAAGVGVALLAVLLFACVRRRR